MNDITPKEAIEILSHYTDLGYGVVIEGEDTSKIKQALSLASKTLTNGTPYNPTVEAKQDELLDYIKLSLKHSDELKEKYRKMHEESNSQYYLYCSDLFEGMAEAYDDLLKKMGESDTQGKSKQGECRTCRHRDPEDKKCECGALERQGCPFPVSDDYFCKFYEKGGAE